MKTLYQHNRFTQFLFAFLAISLTATPAFAANSGPASGGTPVTIEGIHFTQVSVGDSFAMGLTNKGTVYTWGDNTYGELGDGTTIASLTPVQVLTSAGTALSEISAVAAGANFGLALTTAGRVYSWGLNDSGQLGINNTTDSLYATPVLGSNGTGTLSDIKAIEANGSSAYALTKTNGEVYAWGNNGYGQLGNNTINNSLVPGFVLDENGVDPLLNVSQISAGLNFCFALNNASLVLSWGRNHKKQLGDTTLTQRNTPVRVQSAGADLQGITSISGGDLHAIALSDIGTIYTWGNNSDGATGKTTFTGTSIVSSVNISATISEIHAARNSSFALLADGSFYSWGSGMNKTLGDGAATRNTPTLVTSSVAFSSLVDGTSSMLGLDADGNVYGWGSNAYGLAGDGTVTERGTPVLGVNFIASQVTFAGTAGTSLTASGTNWTVNSPAGSESTTVDLVGQAKLRTGITETQTVSFAAGTFEYEAAPVIEPDPAPTDLVTPEPDPVVEPTPDPIVDPIPDPVVDPDPLPTQTETVNVTTLIAPEHDKHPTVKGSATIKQVVVATHGTWTGNPQPTTTIQWYRCSKSVKAGLTALPTKAKCKAIKNATKTNYTLTNKDKAKFVVALISGTNSAGVQSVTSPSTKKVKK